MTKAEYAREYRQARRETARLVIAGKRTIRREYIRVFSRIARVLRENKHKPFLEEQIRGAFPKQELYEFLKRVIVEGRGKAVKLTTDVNKRYVLEALEKVPGHGLDVEKISRLFDGIAERRKQGGGGAIKQAVIPLAVPLLSANSMRHSCVPESHTRPCKRRHTHCAVRVVRNARRKTYDARSGGIHHQFTFHQPDSISLSKSVWNAVGDTEDKILDVVWGGIAQGRDVKTVAADLMAYLKGGPDVVKGRWGKLEPGTKEYAKRLGAKGVDYRAQRLYRSELHRNLQESAVEEGEDNPGCTGKYDWVLMPDRGVWFCECEKLAKGGPYTKDTIPVYPHPNCDCMVQPRLKDHEEFMRDLKDYVNGVPSEGANEIRLWAQSNGLTDDGTVTIRDPGDVPATDMPGDPGRDLINKFLSRDGQKIDSLEQEINFVRNVGLAANNTKEFASIVSRNGTIIKTIEGFTGEIPMSDRFIEKLRNEAKDSLYFIHYHTSGSSFSPEDINSLCGLRSIYQMIITTPENIVFKMQVSGGIMPGEIIFFKQWEALKNAMEKKLNEQVFSGKMTIAQKDIQISRGLSKIFGDLYKWRYYDGK